MLSKPIYRKLTTALVISTTAAVGISLSRLQSPFKMFTPAVKSLSLPIIQPDRTLKDHSAWIYAIAISPDGKTLVNGSYDGTIKIWNLHTGKLLHTLKRHADAVTSPRHHC